MGSTASDHKKDVILHLHRHHGDPPEQIARILHMTVPDVEAVIETQRQREDEQPQLF